MYFIVFWKEWCATIPSCWLFKESKIFKWPPKSKNPTLESIKATLPKENWSTIHYNRFIGPFATYNEARSIEIEALNISTNDEDAFETITNKATNCKPLPMKRAIKKPYRLCSSDEEYDKKSYVKNKRLPKLQKNNISLGEDKESNEKSDENSNEESDEAAEQILKPYNIQKSFQKPPTNYISKNNNKKFTSEDEACVAKCFVDNENNNIGFESQPLEYGNFFSQEPLLTKQSEPTNNNVESNNEIYISETLNDLNDTNQLDEQISLQQNILNSAQLDNDKILKNNSIIHNVIETTRIQNNTDRQNERRTFEHHELCCASCRRDIQTIKKTINSVYLLVLDMSNEAPRDATNNLALNLPITSEKELKDFEILLKEDAAARSQYKKMIKNIGGTTFQKHVRNALTATLTDQMAYKMSWTGQKNSLMVKEMKIIDLIIETIINSRLDSTIDKIQAVIKSWLQHAGDRLPKEERTSKK
ncbi:uncharacterized protein LOC109610423 isoform X1 [Camponotus floridanus]|uniref:uncharacterized protein LOC109610423 isoform X1 n=1 Tax=Camponotus floridanus TaxID=104421 RepID=UPI000DC667DA|nr:uncharacterized protein LOC109610423 isoform X1 [Camponotus floridanus]XP_025261888.1 uncharacterized protein LOC109610423 isoform X1 [Camponotus floridanus]XP_025261889.1 uncharacterized protein LOC109610423 isoform X1 [Camponotus floridanus]